MTKSNGEEPKMGGRMERFQQGVRKRTLLAKKKVQNITKEDVKSYLFRNAFVLLTVTAVIVGKSFDNNQKNWILFLWGIWLPGNIIRFSFEFEDYFSPLNESIGVFGAINTWESERSIIRHYANQLMVWKGK